MPDEPDGTTKLRLTLEKHISEQRTGYGGKLTLYRHANLNNTGITVILVGPWPYQRQVQFSNWTAIYTGKIK